VDVRTVATALSVVSLIVAPPLRGHTEPPDERGQTATALALFGAKRGLLVSSRGALRISRDGGASWQPAGRFAVTGLFPVSASVGFATSKRGLLRTDDAGRNWRLILRSSGNPSFADPRHGWIDGPKPQATDDGGRTWRPLRTPGTDS
jgi:photosystem II stability/assembly factor-like uncharacterized protein